jgi:hypothetical protein
MLEKIVSEGVKRIPLHHCKSSVWDFVNIIKTEITAVGDLPL